MSKYLLLFIVSLCCFGGEAVLRGTVRLSDGPLKEGRVIYYPSWQQTPTDIQKVKVAPDGTFAIAVKVPESYQLIFSHPGKEPHAVMLELIGNEEKEIAITLDRYALPKNNFSVVFERDGYDWSKQIPMREENGVYYLEQKSERERERYQVTGLKRTMQGQDPIVAVDNSGDYISEAPVVDGLVTIRFDPTLADFRSGASQALIENVRGTHLSLSMIRLENSIIAYLLDKRAKRDKGPNTDGLKQLCERLDELIATQESETAGLILATMAHRFLGRYTDAYNRGGQLRQAYQADPTILVHLPLEDVFNLLIGSRKTRQQSRSREDLDKRCAILSKYLAMDISLEKKLKTIYFLGTMYEGIDPVEQRKWLNKAIEDYPNSYAASNSRNILRQIQQVGQKAPDFALEDEEGKIVRLSDFQGKYVLLDFWASWCSPCIKEIPNLVDVYDRIDRSQVEFISICLDTKKSPLAKLTKKYKMAWTQLGSLDGFQAKVADQFSISYLPNVLLINPEGVVVAQNTGLQGGDLLITLSKYLGSN